jgi:hypothetical protein
MIRGGMKAMTQRTTKAEHFVAVLYFKIQQINNDRIDEDIPGQVYAKKSIISMRTDFCEVQGCFIRLAGSDPDSSSRIHFLPWPAYEWRERCSLRRRERLLVIPTYR